MEKNWKEANKEIPRIIWAAARGKWHATRSDPRILAYVAFEWVLILLLLIGVAVYLDPQTNIIQAPYNYIGFGAVVLLAITLYLAANPYHRERNTRYAKEPPFIQKSKPAKNVFKPVKTLSKRGVKKKK
ncbi:MAG: hypothetical protein HY393_00525 [Candidatus Diapherotrites archaeon]|nr:hypothetical protein [Candidatus Diapherotrites archaeon]